MSYERDFGWRLFGHLEGELQWIEDQKRKIAEREKKESKRNLLSRIFLNISKYLEKDRVEY